MEVENSSSITPSFPATGDMILRQPDNIVHRILTYLDLSALVRTTVLSKQWRYLWITSSQNLKFHERFFTLHDLRDKQKRTEPETRLIFAEQTLSIRSSLSSSLCLKNLELHDVQISSQRDITRLDNCIRYAIECDLKRLDLRVRSYHGWHYILPPTLFGHSGLVALCLSWCWFKSSSFPSNMSPSCLKVLHFEVAVVESMKLIEDLIASCPLLQDLTLFNCVAFDRVLKFGVINRVLKIDGIVNNPRLIKIKIEQCTFERIEIDAPGLKSLIFSQAMSHMRCYQVRAPCDIVMTSCKNMTCLVLYNIDHMSASINNILSRLSQLKSIILYDCTIETIQISSSILKGLEIESCKKLVKVEIDGPNLSMFCYVGRKMISIYFASNALDFSVYITLHTIPSNVESTIWFIQFVEFLGRFNNAKTLQLYVKSHKNVIVPRELRASLVPPLYNVEHLVLDIRGESFTQTIDQILDGVLWLSPHPVNVSFARGRKKMLELTFIYDEIDTVEGKYCDCFSSRIQCWRHSMKEVKIENLGMNEDEVEKNINSFFEHALSLRKFEQTKNSNERVAIFPR